MLKTKLEFVDIDKTGGIITIKDSTGIYSITNPEGYGFPNASVGDMNKIIFTISQYNSDEIYKQTYVRVADPLYPEYLTTPTINQITAGTPIEFSSISLNQSSIFIPFEDGVFDFNMYNVMTTAKTGVVAAQGNPFITGSGLDTYLVYDSILVNEKLYDIDKTKNSNGGTILFLVQELEDSSTLFYPAYRANMKALTDKATTTCLYNKVGKLALDCGCNSSTKEILADIELFRWAAQYAFDNQDYIKATELIVSAQRACESNCNC